MSVPVLARLLWRPMAAWGAFVCGSLAFVVAVLAYVVRGGVRVPADAAQAEWNARLELALGSALLPLALGSLFGAALGEVLRCSFAPFLPYVMKRIARELLVAGLAAAAATAMWCDAQPGAQRAELFVGLALAWFAAGALCVDPAWGRIGRIAWLPQVLVLAPIFFAPEIVAFGERRPLACGIVALVVAVAALQAPFARRVQRARQAAPVIDELASLGNARRSRAAWRGAVPLQGEDDWTRATLHEGFGHAPGGWLGAAVRFAAIWSGVLVAMVLVVALLEERGVEHAARYLHGALAGGADTLPFVPTALCVWTAMFFLGHPAALHGAGPYPLSRARRAAVTWRACGRVVLAVFLASALVLWGVTVLARRASGTIVPSEGLPEFVAALLAAACGAPLAQAVRLRWMDERAPPPGLPGSLIGLVGLLTAVPSIALAFLWRAAAEDEPLAVLGSAIGVLVGVQLGWRAYLDRHYSSRDLPA